MTTRDVVFPPGRQALYERNRYSPAIKSNGFLFVSGQVGSTEDGSPFLVMELLDGESLRARMNAQPMPLRKVVDICTQLARALGAAHAKSIVHRDLKPENVYLIKQGPAKILDFGLAKLSHKEEAYVQDDATRAMFTKPGMVMGTVGYMAPES